MRSFRTRLAAGLALLLFALAAPPDGRAQPAADTLRTFLPEQMAGLSRGEMSTQGPSSVVATYHPASAADGLTYELLLFYGADHQQKGRDQLERIDDPMTRSTIGEAPVHVGEHPVHVVKDTDRSGLFAFPGNAFIVGKAEAEEQASWNPKAVHEQLTDLLRALDLERLAALTLDPEQFDTEPSISGGASISVSVDTTGQVSASVDTTTGQASVSVDTTGQAAVAVEKEASAPAEAPAPLTSYTADVGGAQVGFDHPKNWTVVNLHRKTRLARGVVVMRDPEAAAKMLEEGISLDPGRELRLLTPGNAGVAVAMIGEGPEPKAFLEDVVEQAPLKQAVRRAPRTVPIGAWEGRAHETLLDGMDADGRSVVWRPLTFEKDGRLFLVSILRSADASEATREAIQSLLGSLRVSVR